MGYNLSFLPLAAQDILDIEASLYEFSPTASERHTNEIDCLTKTLTEHPFMYQAFQDDPFYRSMPLCYDYRLFYHVAEVTKTIEIHRVLHGTMNLEFHLSK